MAVSNFVRRSRAPYIPIKHFLSARLLLAEPRHHEDRRLDLPGRRLDDTLRDARQGAEKRAAHRERFVPAGDVQQPRVAREAALRVRLSRRVVNPTIVPSTSAVVAAARTRGRKTPTALGYGRPSPRELLQRPSIVAPLTAARLDEHAFRAIFTAASAAAAADTWLDANLLVIFA